MRKTGGLALCLWLMAGMGEAQTLSLQAYLNEVKTQGPGYQSDQDAVVGLEKQSHEQDLTYSPVLRAGYNHFDDSQQQTNPFIGPHTLMDTAGVSITDQLPFGPSISLGYDFTNTNSPLSTVESAFISGFGLNPDVIPTSYYQVSPVISLSVPLFKNFGGAQTAAGVHEVQYQLESEEKNSAYEREALLYNAKLAYWNLALARAQVTIHESTLARCQKIWGWTEKRVRRNLEEAPDALDAEASVQMAQLDLESAMDSVQSASLQFNRYRGIQGGAVPENLESLETCLSQEKVIIPETPPERLDLKAVEEATLQQKAAYDQAHQNIYPDITLNASWQGNGLDPNYGVANSIAWGTNYPSWTLGAQLNLPLDVFTSSRVAEGYKKNYQSALLNLKDKRLEVNQEWLDLKDHLSNVDKRLKMATEIEAIQREKANEERKLLEYGRTTEFQVLSFENDYNTAQLNRLAILSEKLSVMAQAQWWLETKLNGFPQAPGDP